MSRVNIFLTLSIVVVFVLLMVFAGQPITSEADLVQRWYDALCHPSANQSILRELTWRGNELDQQLQVIIDAYRSANGFTNGCTAVVNHNVIYFQSIPPELASTIEQIKFVAVNVYAPDQPAEPNHVTSVQFGVHVLFYKTGMIKILPHFIPDSPLGLHQGQTPVTLYNNDGLLMGQVQLVGSLIRVLQNDVVRYGIPLQLSTDRPWGRCWIRIYINGIEVAPERFADVLPLNQQANFIPPSIENVLPHLTLQRVVWFSRTNPVDAIDVQVSIDAYQTLWDLRALPVVLKVR